MKAILAAVDFSAVTPRVVAESVALVEAPAGRIVLVHVTEPTATIIDFAVASISVARVDEARVARAMFRLEQLQRELAQRHVATEIRHAVGFPVTEIIAAAQQMGADGIVLGSHGHSAFRDLFVGSTAAGVVKRAPCPVVVVPAASLRAAR